LLGSFIRLKIKACQGPNSQHYVSCQLMNGPDVVNCDIVFKWKGLPGINTPAYWDYSYVQETIHNALFSY
jgi:hypothetical protein